MNDKIATIHAVNYLYNLNVEYQKKFSLLFITAKMVFFILFDVRLGVYFHNEKNILMLETMMNCSYF